MSLKDSWKKVGHDFAALGTDIGKSVMLSVRKGAEAASDWATEDDKKKAAGGGCDCGKDGCGCEGNCDCKDDACDCKCEGENGACDCGCDNGTPQS